MTLFKRISNAYKCTSYFFAKDAASFFSGSLVDRQSAAQKHAVHILWLNGYLVCLEGRLLVVGADRHVNVEDANSGSDDELPDNVHCSCLRLRLLSVRSGKRNS